MRAVLLAAFLVVGCGMGFDQEDDGPDEPTAEECVAAGGTVRDGTYCDFPASGGYVVAKLASAQAPDGGAHD